MAASARISSDVNLPTALADYARREAALDASAVLDFLAEAERRSGETWERPVRFPAAFLLGVGAAMRVLRWEISGIISHLECGLPRASQLLQHLMRVCLENTAEARDKWITQISNRISEIAVNCVAWQGHTILNADVVLGVGDDDELVNAIATFVLQLQEGTEREQTEKN